jgi:PTH2 family peptidyl-tRNA hydrolase
MSIGKTTVQVAHGAVMAGEEARIHYNKWWKNWIDEGQRKVTLKVLSEDELFEFETKAKIEGFPLALIRDQGLTEIPPGTATCLAIGPIPVDRIDPITGRLPLL